MKQFAYLFLLSTWICSCSSDQAVPNQLTDAEKKEGWILLFDGKTLDGWHVYNKGKIASSWAAENGALRCRFDVPDLVHGDLVTDQEYQNYDFRFDWKIEKQGNSGVFINVLERADIPSTWASGPEYQLLEKTHPDYAANEKKRPGCLYGYAAQKTPLEPFPTGEWNHSRIVQKDGKVEFYLNSILTAEADLNAQEWKDWVAGGNFKIYPEFGKYTSGRIGLQDWAKGVSFRNVKIKRLNRD